MKVFISMPMNSKSVEQVKQEMSEIKNDIRVNLGDEVTFIDSIIDDADKDIAIKGGDIGVWYLGKSIELLAEAELVFFDKGWKDSRGCRIENLVAKEYGKYCIEL